MDSIASIVAYRHCRSVVVTASVHELSFLHPIKLGELVTLYASVNYTSNRSIEVGVKVLAENAIPGEKRHASSAYLIFVSLDSNGKAQSVPQITPHTEDEKRRFKEGEKRREMRLKNK
jgi:acyl-CoA hydrolase